MQNEHESTLPTIFVIFGATGDLTKRKLIPALFRLYQDKALPSLMHIVGFARRPFSDEGFQAYVREVLAESGADKDSFENFSRMFSYRPGDFTDPKGFDGLAQLLGKQDDVWRTCSNKLFHLAVAPEHYEGILNNLSISGLTIPCSPEEGWTRVLVEKPFGKDLETAQSLDSLLGKLFREEQIYRIDHYLGKDTVQNILAFRFSNTFLDPSWDARSIASITIKLHENITIEGRGNFYDGVGALRDVGQNHMLQLLALFTMENPGEFDANSIRESRAAVLDSLEAMDVQDIVRSTLRARYKGYADEDGVTKDSQTETFFRIESQLNLPKWRGVPIVLESGKALEKSVVEVLVEFRHHTPCLCPFDAAQGKPQHFTNILRYEVQPHEGITMSFWAKKPGKEMVIEEKSFSFDYGRAFSGSEFLDAYAKLLLDAIEGNQTSFVSTEEITASWKFIDPIIRAWEESAVPLLQYEKGMGADSIIATHVELPAKQISYIGLGKMGANMVERLVDYGWDVTAYDPDETARKKVEEKGIRVITVISDLIRNLRGSRLGGRDDTGAVVWLMVPHNVVDGVITKLIPHLKSGDTVIDGGNSFYKDSIRRGKELQKIGVNYLDVGVSGGPSGARKGACLMIGGDKAVYKQLVGLFSDLAIAGGYDYMGELGAGHFVKMVHNGIEYGMMQALAEGFAVLKQWRGELDLEHIAHLYGNGSVIESRLVHWLKDAYMKHGTDLKDISGSIAQSGEGKWTVEAAHELGIPVPIIEDALQFRTNSENNPSYTGQIVSALRNQFGGHNVRSAGKTLGVKH